MRPFVRIGRATAIRSHRGILVRNLSLLDVVLVALIAGFGLTVMGWKTA
jgi:hypothetical protein